MKQLLFLFFLIFAQITVAQNVIEFSKQNNYKAYFEEAYQLYPNIPKGVLEAVAHTNTRIKHIKPNEIQPSCLGLPQYFGVMGLVENGHGYFQNSLLNIAELSGYKVEAIKNDARTNILAYASAYSQLVTKKGLEKNVIETHTQILHELSEFPVQKKAKSQFAFDTHAYSILKLLNNEDFQASFQTDKYEIDMKEVFGENLKVLSASNVIIDKENAKTETGYIYTEPNQKSMSCNDISPSFPGTLIFTAADPSNYGSRSGTAITHITIHTMQGSYAGSISWFQNPAANVSAHYNIRALDGQVTQMVCEADRGFHVSSANPYTIGIEHEGYIDDASWYTEAMYYVSAQLSIDIMNRYGIEPERCYDNNGDSGLNALSTNCYKIKGHQHYPSQTHIDPGPLWDWEYYYDLLNENNTNTLAYSACSGTFEDSGGSGNYGNDERQFYLIAPTGASSVTLNFNSFNVENNYDFLYVYDGDSHNDELLATLTGTSLPAAITAKSGKMLLEFRTDCATIAAGWNASWTCSTATSPCAAPSGLSVAYLSTNEVVLSWSPVSGATNYTLSWHDPITNTTNTETVTTNSYELSGLGKDQRIEWSVVANCGGTSSAASGDEFINDNVSTSSYTNTNCEGTFTDDGDITGNYLNNQNYTYVIAPTGATDITLTFSSFELENNYDYMYIYNGNSTAGTLIGTYSGTNSPGTIVGTSGALTIVFDSDNWTTKAGWEATWTCTNNNTGMPTLSNPIIQSNNTGALDCSLTYHSFYDSGGASGNYADNEATIQTICNPDPTKAVRLSFRPLSSGNPQLDLSASSLGNDYIYIYDGDDISTDNLIGVYTGSTFGYPQPGTFVSSGECITVRFESDAATNLAGWNARAYCVNKPSNNGTNYVASGNTLTFTDTGGTGGNYGNNESYTTTYCPDASVTNGDVITASFNGTSGIEENWDYLYVFDGNDVTAPLLAVFTGNGSDQNNIGTITASTDNPTGCLTFQFFSDVATVSSGWNATIALGQAVQGNGADDCANATNITQFDTPFSGSNVNATGYPNASDPSLGISIPGLAECSGSASITRLENTIWYQFQTGNDTDYSLDFSDMTCHQESNSGAGIQLAVFEANSCQSGSSWGTPVYCNDFIQTGDLISLQAYLQANSNYYIMFDGFAGQHCYFNFQVNYTPPVATDINVKFKLFLEGPYDDISGEMTSNLSINNMIPLAQPFNIAPFNYAGTEVITSYPAADIVDWILVQARDGANWGTVIESRACFVLKDGSVIDIDGSAGVNFSNLNSGTNYRFAIYHKGHLGVLTASDIVAGTTTVYDFTALQSMAEGIQQTKLNGSVYTLIGGDYDNNGVINNDDFNVWAVLASVVNQYVHHDGDCNGVVNNEDFNLWTINRSKVGEVSIQNP